VYFVFKRAIYKYPCSSKNNFIIISNATPSQSIIILFRMLDYMTEGKKNGRNEARNKARKEGSRAENERNT